MKSAAVPFQRPVSTGTQSYGSNPDNYPITQPMPKMTSLLQVLSQSLSSSRHVQGGMGCSPLPPPLTSPPLHFAKNRLHTCINEKHSTARSSKNCSVSVSVHLDFKWSMFMHQAPRYSFTLYIHTRAPVNPSPFFVYPGGSTVVEWL